MTDPSEELSEMKIKIFDLQTQILAALVRLRAFQDYSEEVWKSQGISSPLEQSILRRMERERANETLRQYADTDPMYSSVVKKFFDHQFGKIDED